ncbi:MAG: hypothetical protein QXM96_04185 [Candidatus Woesearchaeota archaeon]
MRVYVKGKENIPSDCPYEGTMMGGVSFSNIFFKPFQSSDGSIFCNNCGRLVGWSKKRIDNATIREDNVCP